jgi:hypothetical protein
LPPVKQSRELDPLDAVLDSEPHKQPVEMRFHRALGNVQIASDFRVVTSLEQQIDDLPFPWSYLYEIFFHKEYAPDRTRPGRRKWLRNRVRGHFWIRVLC